MTFSTFQYYLWWTKHLLSNLQTSTVREIMWQWSDFTPTEECAKGHVLPLSTTALKATMSSEDERNPFFNMFFTKLEWWRIRRISITKTWWWLKGIQFFQCVFHATNIWCLNQARHAPMTNGFGEVAAPAASTPRRTAVVARSMSYIPRVTILLFQWNSKLLNHLLWKTKCLMIYVLFIDI